MSARSWLNRRRLDEDDFQDEIRAHLANRGGRTRRRRRRSRPARASIVKEFGNVTLTTEAARSVWRPRWLEALRDWLNDARFAVARARQGPGFSLTVIAVLALGIGLNTAVFTLLKSLALSPLAGVEGSAGLGVVLNEMPAGRRDGLSYPDYQYLRDHDRAFTGLTGSRSHRRQRRPRQPSAARDGRARHRQLLSGARRRRADRPHAAAVG